MTFPLIGHCQLEMDVLGDRGAFDALDGGFEDDWIATGPPSFLRKFTEPRSRSDWPA
jgi:hypothetical protein